jgi:hypothetical protein
MAQTLRTKVQYDWHQIETSNHASLRHLILSLLSSAGPEYIRLNRPVRVQLSIALADLTVQMDAVPVELERDYKDLVSLAALAADARFETLTRIVWTGVILALSVVAFMLWRMLKHPALVK